MKDRIHVERSDLVPEPNAGDTLRRTSKTQMQEQIKRYPKSMGSRKTRNMQEFAGRDKQY
jgi:hypothetical protein